MKVIHLTLIGAVVALVSALVGVIVGSLAYDKSLKAMEAADSDLGARIASMIRAELASGHATAVFERVDVVRRTDLASPLPAVTSNAPTTLRGALTVAADLLVTGRLDALAGGTWGTLQINGTATSVAVKTARNATVGEALAAGRLLLLNEVGMRTVATAPTVNESLALVRGLQVARWRWNGTNFASEFAGALSQRITGVTVPTGLQATSEFARELLASSENVAGAANNTGAVRSRVQTLDVGALVAHLVGAIHALAQRVEALEAPP